jgi:DNA processing protein
VRSPEFWQRVLSAELAPAKNRVLLEELGSLHSDPLSQLLSSSLLTETEKLRIQSVGVDKLGRFLSDGGKLLEFDDFPELLFESGNVSPALFIKGDSECLHEPTVAIVGTRNASLYGRACAQKFAYALAKAGVTVVSGGALGIDAAAHKGAMDAGGKTAAVLATGMDIIYPRVHSGLFQQITQSGCLVSQFAVGSKMGEFKFLIRNVLIASLSSAVIVIEAPAKSGALSTATAANELGREVFVVPANIDMNGFQGSFALLRDGATLLTHPDQILESLQIEAKVQESVIEATDMGHQILAVLSSSPMSTEKIVELTGLEPAEVLSEITILELDGRVMRGSGGYIVTP